VPLDDRRQPVAASTLVGFELTKGYQLAGAGYSQRVGRFWR
jgi:hypothetical protein